MARRDKEGISIGTIKVGGDVLEVRAEQQKPDQIGIRIGVWYIADLIVKDEKIRLRRVRYIGHKLIARTGEDQIALAEE
jgi:hypothetical protein